MAAPGSGARPRFVWTITPVALRTGRSRRRDAAASVARASSSRPTASSARPAAIAFRRASIAARAARTARPAEVPSARSGAASSSTEGSALRRSRSSGSLALDPALLATLDLLLPDRRLRLHPIDDLAGPGKRLIPVRRGHGHRHARLRQRHLADAVLGRGGAQAVPLDGVGDDPRDPLLGHLDVGLVVEPLHLARHATERDDRTRPPVAPALDQRIQRERL